MRLIDKNKYNEDLKKEFIDVQDILDQGFNRGLYKAQSLLDNQPTVNQWISVEDELPKESGEYLVWYEYYSPGNEDMRQVYGIGYYIRNGRWGGDVSGMKAKCLAWQPLPKPYEPKGSE